MHFPFNRLDGTTFINIYVKFNRIDSLTTFFLMIFLFIRFFTPKIVLLFCLVPAIRGRLPKRTYYLNSSKTVKI